MSYLRGIEEELVRGDVEVFHEFDSSHFIMNAKSALHNKVETVNLQAKLTHYGDMIDKAINSFVNIRLDNNALRTFVEVSPKFNIESHTIMIKSIEDVNGIILRPQYLDQYVKTVMDTIDKVVKGEITSDSQIIHTLMDNYPMKVQKQVVRTSLPYGATSRDLLKNAANSTVKVDNKYISAVVLPFVERYESLKDDVMSEASNTLTCVKEMSDKVASMIRVINTIKTGQSLPMERVRLLDQVYYNATRGILEVISFTAFMCVRKINLMTSNVATCNKLYLDIMNIYEGSRSVIEAVTDERFVTNLDNAAMCDEIIKGRVDAFQALAHNIYELHTGIPKVTVGDIMNVKDDYEAPGQNTSDAMLDEQEFDASIYDTIAKTYIEISNGIDRLATRSDDYLMIFDDIINYAGFTLRLEDRFRNELNQIEDLSLYQGAMNTGGRNPEVYRRMLAEVKAFPENMQKIADNALDTITKIDALNDRYTNNINGEFKDLETINELKIFMRDLVVQYRAYTELMVAKMMNRLKTIGEMITEMSGKINGEKPQEDYATLVPMDTIDYVESVFDSIMDEIEMENASYFESLQLDYFSERERINKGLTVVFEDENTKVTVQDNNTQHAQGTARKLISKIGDWYRNTMEKFMAMFGRESKKNLEWLTRNKEGLMNRSYSNVTITILPYKNMTPETITGDIGKLTAIINGLTPANLGTLNSKDKLYQKIFPFIQGGVKDGDTLKDQFTKYYKVGTAELKVVSISNSELKNEITGSIIPYCENYYNSYINDIQNNLNILTTAVDNLCTKISGGATTESTSFFEADTPTPTVSDNSGGTTTGTDNNAQQSGSTTTDQPDNTGNVSEIVEWLKGAIKYYQGSILNAVRDRKNDYFKVLSSLAPKAPVTAQQATDVKPDHPEQTGTEQTPEANPEQTS